jgi:hypothetical protein
MVAGKDLANSINVTSGSFAGSNIVFPPCERARPGTLAFICAHLNGHLDLLSLDCATHFRERFWQPLLNFVSAEIEFLPGRPFNSAAIDHRLRRHCR